MEPAARLAPAVDSEPAATACPPDRVRALEAVEVAAWRCLYEGLSAPVAHACRVHRIDLGPGIAVMSGAIDELAFNRVHGPGLARHLDDATLDGVIRRYREAGARRFFVQVCPGTPPELVRRLEARGFRLHNRWAKLWRSGAPPAAAPTDLRLVRVGPGRDPDGAAAFGAIVHSTFGWDGPVAAWMADLVGRPGWCHYLAFDGDRAVACAGLFTRGEWGWLGPAATLPSHRGRGGQRALLALRVRDALALGVRDFSVETAEDRPDRPVTSFRNLIRSGFRLAYVRPNYLLEVDEEHASRDVSPGFRRSPGPGGGVPFPP